MVALDVILRVLALVGLRFLGQEIYGVTLLQQGIVLVLLLPDVRCVNLTSKKLFARHVINTTSKSHRKKIDPKYFFTSVYTFRSEQYPQKNVYGVAD